MKGEKVDPGGPMCSPAAGLDFPPHSQHPPRKDRRGNRVSCSACPKWEGETRNPEIRTQRQRTQEEAAQLSTQGTRLLPGGPGGGQKGDRTPRAAAAATMEPLKGVWQKTVVERGGEPRGRGQPGEFTRVVRRPRSWEEGTAVWPPDL